MTSLTIGIDLGGTKIAGGLVAHDGNVVGDAIVSPTHPPLPLFPCWISLLRQWRTLLT